MPNPLESRIRIRVNARNVSFKSYNGSYKCRLGVKSAINKCSSWGALNDVLKSGISRNEDKGANDGIGVRYFSIRGGAKIQITPKIENSENLSKSQQ